MSDEFVDNLNHGCSHLGCLEIIIGAQTEISQRFPQHTSLRDVDRYEFEDTILRHDANDHRSLGLVVEIDQGYPTCPRLEHASAGLVKRF